MASYSLDYDSRSVTFSVSGLTSGQMVYFYVRKDPFDGTYVVDGLTAYKSSGTTMTQTFSGLTPGQRYAANVVIDRVGSGLGTKYFTTPAEGGRPQNWSWAGIIWSGCPLENLTADVWNRFTARINEFRVYKGGSAYGFTTAVSGQTLLITLFREAETAIGGISDHGTVPTSRELSMTYFDALAAALNAVP